MAGIVKSLQRVTVTIASGQTSGTGTLSGITTLANCVPFITHRGVSESSTTDGDYGVWQPDVELTNSTTVTCTTGRSATRVKVVEVTVVEFDSSRVTVQSDTFSIASSSETGTASIPTAVVTADSFIVAHGLTNSAAGSNVATSAFNYKFSTTSQITFTRDNATTAAVTGHWYVVESDQSDFSVQHDTLARDGGNTTASVTLTSTVDDESSFVLCSWFVDSSGPKDYLGHIGLNTAGTAVEGTWFDTSGSDVDIEIQTITFAGTGQVVWRGLHSDATDATSTNVNLPSAVSDLDFAMANIPTSQSLSNTYTDSSNSWNGPYSDTHTIEFVDSDTITLKRVQGNSGQTVNVDWEVIQWEESGGAPPATRRVMVIT